MALILSDTDVLVDVLNGRSPQREAIALLVSRGQLAASTVTVFELLNGATTTSAIQHVDRLLTPIVILDLTLEAARRASEVYRLLRSVGLRIGERDALIAGVALANGCPLLTRNVREFERVPNLRLLGV